MNRFASIIRQAAAIAAVLVGALDTTSLPPNVRATLVAVGGILLSAEHILGSLSDPDTVLGPIVSKIIAPPTVSNVQRPTTTPPED